MSRWPAVRILAKAFGQQRFFRFPVVQVDFRFLMNKNRRAQMGIRIQLLMKETARALAYLRKGSASG